MQRLSKYFLFINLLFYIVGTPAIAKNKRLADRSIEEILSQYVFIGDFTTKPEVRQQGAEVFWRYPVVMPKTTFDLSLVPLTNHQEINAAFPATQGVGRPYEHLNRGRYYFLQGDFASAKKTWLSARARYGTDFEHHRRNDYLIANSFLYEAYEKAKKNPLGMQDSNIQAIFSNANTFLSWAFGVKKDIDDPLLDEVASRQLYNQAVIYYTYEKWPSAFGIATRGLNFLRKTGRSEYKSEFRKMLGELYIRNRSYLKGIRELDLSLRVESNPKNGSYVFSRAGDVYFDLNNFELAEEVYELAIRLDRERKYIKPIHYILRGESLFWLGRYDEALKMMSYGLRVQSSLEAYDEILPDAMQALASLRIADAYLALGKVKDAKLSYFKHSQEYRSDETAVYAKLRLACLELPAYEGNNIKHARMLLSDLKDDYDKLPKPAMELAWTCEMASYSQHERNQALIDKASEFVKKYPKSRLIKDIIPSVREVKQREIYEFFKRKDYHGAVDFFEKTKDILYPVIDEKLKRDLFYSYVLTNQSEKAKQFYPGYNELSGTDFERIIHAVMLAEVSKQGQDKWSKLSKRLSEDLVKKNVVVSLSPGTKFMVERIQISNGSEDYAEWILNLTFKWSDEDLKIGCSMFYPATRKQLKNESPAENKKHVEITKAFISKNLIDLFKYDIDCAYALMELETQWLYKGRQDELVDLYLDRDYVPMTKESAKLFYLVAEKAGRLGRKADSEQILNDIISRGKQSIPEVSFAKALLDKRRTQLENLWE